jgi:hypothetical protein
MRRLNGRGQLTSQIEEESKSAEVEDERPGKVDDTIIQTQSSHLGQLISNEGGIEHAISHHPNLDHEDKQSDVGDRTVNKSVNISVNNLLMKNKSGLNSSHQKVQKRAMIIDIKQLLE